MLVYVFEKFLFNFVITLVSVLKSVTKSFLKTVLKSVCEKRFVEQVLKILPTRKKIVHSRFF